MKDTMQYFSEKLKIEYSVDLDNIPQEEWEKQIEHLAQTGHSYAIDYIFTKYMGLVRSKAKLYFLVGADKEDIVQEGLIGLHKAIRDFNPDKNRLFRSFADLCITRQLITAVKGSTRQKHIPLNSYISLNRRLYEEENDTTMLDLIENERVSNPEDIFLNEEKGLYFRKLMAEILSDLEAKVIEMYLEGMTYHDIADVLHQSPKVIDNALQRAKKKFEKAILENKFYE